jgi:hypothetical protein
MTHSIIKTDNYLLVVDDSEIKEGNYFFFKEGIVTKVYKSDSVEQKVSIENFEHDRVFNYKKCKKIIAHLPLNNSPALQGVDLLPPLEDEVEKLAEEFKSSYKKVGVTDYEVSSFIVGYNKAKEKYKYTEEQLKTAIHKAIIFSEENRKITSGEYAVKFYKFYGESIQSLNLPKMPNAFECEIKCFEEEYRKPLRQVSITTPKGHTQWVGKYIY